MQFAGHKTWKSWRNISRSSLDEILWSGKSRLVVARVLREAIGEGIDSRETVELKKEYLCGLENFLADKPPPLSLAGVAESTKSTQVNEGKKSKFIDVENIFRCEFKIKGSVGEPGDENKYIVRQFGATNRVWN